MARPIDDETTVNTLRSGPFRFRIGLDAAVLRPLFDRVGDAHRRFSSMPILPDIAVELEREVLVSSVFGTNTIEAGTLSEQETAEALELTPAQARADEQRRVVNIREAYRLAETYAASWAAGRVDAKPSVHSPLVIVEDMFQGLHRIITDGLTHTHNVPGQYRDNPKGANTKVGDLEHGGIYTPPKGRDDIEKLMKHFVQWLNSEPLMALPPLYRAPLAHYYFERIHPFWDGNGRVGRVVEAMILKAAGFRYAPFAQSRYYLDHIDEYFTVFNSARKAEEKKAPYPNTVFVEFFLNGMLTVLDRLHDRANEMIGYLLYRNRLRLMLEEKDINHRQYTIVSQLLGQSPRLTVPEMQRQPWYESLYTKLTAKTRGRDLKGLQQKRLISIDEDRRITPLIVGADKVGA